MGSAARPGVERRPLEARFPVGRCRLWALVTVGHDLMLLVSGIGRPHVRPRPCLSAFQGQAVSVRVLKTFRFEDGADAQPKGEA